MSKPSFVGYQEKVEIPQGYELIEIKKVIESQLSKDQLFAYLSDQELLSRWFYRISKFNSRPGGKVLFIDEEGIEHEAICTSIVFGREISFLADLFGNFQATVSTIPSGGSITISFKILTDLTVAKAELINSTIEKLRLLVS
jgi:hypothetical protein